MEPVKRQFSPEHLEKLKIAREKALAVRQKKASEKKLEKELATKEHEQKMETIKEKLGEISKPKKKSEPKPAPEPESEPESEPEVIIKKKTKKKAKKIVIVEDSDTDEEQQQVIFVKRTKDRNVVSAPIPIPQAPQLVQQEPPGLPRKQYIDPTAIYSQHYSRLGFR